MKHISFLADVTEPFFEPTTCHKPEPSVVYSVHLEQLYFVCKITPTLM